ncbi:MAG: hypothetical protein EP308_11630 [Burkholderiales bacterium]|nr:MAG: hypothetical protein EP308_11630 [Burkholderiales bacterium]
MPAVDPSTRFLTQAARRHGGCLLGGSDEPHEELLALLWGPRFDREHALGLWAMAHRRQPVESLPMLPDLLAAADRFDRLPTADQHRLRRLVIRHRSMGCTTQV